jgi:hypothetical protein
MKTIDKLFHVQRAKRLVKSAFNTTRLTDKEAWIPICKCLVRLEERCKQLEGELEQTQGIRSEVGQQ